MSTNKDFYANMSAEEKEIYNDFCEFQNLDIHNQHSYALWFEFKKSGLTW